MVKYMFPIALTIGLVAGIIVRIWGLYNESRTKTVN